MPDSSKKGSFAGVPDGMPGAQGMVFNEPLIFERSVPGRQGFSLDRPNLPTVDPHKHFGAELVRAELDGFPELSETEVVRHFVRLSQWNYGVDSGLYPLGSCTMKYNPKINEQVARLDGFSNLHPQVPEQAMQGALELMRDLEKALAEIAGLDRVTLQPAAGAHGEFAGMLMIRAYHQKQGDPRSKVLIPDTAHGTNPASCTLAGYRSVAFPSGPDGKIDPAVVADLMDDQTAAVMITNPNTLGLFETSIREVARIVHDKGGLVYCDGANLNAVMGVTRPGDFGVDVLHYNLHKTFSTPHGGGGPGAGPVGVTKRLAPFLPTPTVEDDQGRYYLDFDRPDSIGQVKTFFGNFGVLVRAFTYISELGAAGLSQVSRMAVLNANYILSRLRNHYHLVHDQPCMHECVFSEKRLAALGVHTMDVAKRLIDYGYHPPTVYFPLVVKGALMIEPTETESPESLDQFCEAMIAIADEAKNNPELLLTAPHNVKLRRLDEVQAARQLTVRWTPSEE